MTKHETNNVRNDTLARLTKTNYNDLRRHRLGYSNHVLLLPLLVLVELAASDCKQESLTPAYVPGVKIAEYLRTVRRISGALAPSWTFDRDPVE